MRPGDVALANQLRIDLLSFKRNNSLPGINLKANLDCFTDQLVDSIRRIKYITTIRDKAKDPQCLNTSSIAFDPLKGASLFRQQGNINEAFWLIFLSIHFGKSSLTNWRLVRDVYGKLGQPNFWTWVNTSVDPNNFRHWLNANQNVIKGHGRFGNHRKYESLDALGDNGTGEAIESYINWVGPNHNHLDLIIDAQANVGQNPRDMFNYLYDSMNNVVRFGRTARFDYLTMIGKFRLAAIEPGSTYMNGATGPLKGARLLFGGSTTANLSLDSLETSLAALERHLSLFFGMQVLEDALCNWQKSPSNFIHFNG